MGHLRPSHDFFNRDRSYSEVMDGPTQTADLQEVVWGTAKKKIEI